MKIRFIQRKKIAIAFLALWVFNLVLPVACYALTSGPSQPEVQAFQPAGVSDMVDLFTGDFKYNIPLLDIDGYPINLSYQSGSGMDDEACWTGLGWNVNVGAINRQVRGLPDDMAGDTVETDNYTKPKVTVGGRLSFKIETTGVGIQKGSMNQDSATFNPLKASGSLSLGVFNDNYTGIGAEVGVNAGLSFSYPNESSMTAGLGLGVTSSTASGVEVTPYMNLGIQTDREQATYGSASLSSSLGYNTRSGLKALTLGSSFDIGHVVSSAQVNHKGATFDVNQKIELGGGGSGSFITYNTEPISPDIQVPYRTSYGSFSIDVGGSLEFVFLGGGATGYKSVREIALQKIITPAYGFLYAERGKNQQNAIMDFNREKENPIIPELPNIAVPVHTPDLFTYTSQTGSGQFRLYRGGSGAFFDHAVTDDDNSTSIGGDIGLGYIAHGGVTYYQQTTINANRKWVSNNNYLPKADFQDISYTQPNKQHVYFKMVGEKTPEDSVMVSRLHGTQTLAVSINAQTANAKFANATLDSLVKQTRQVNQTEISYLTGTEAMKGALDTNIRVYQLYSDTTVDSLPSKPIPVDSVHRVNNWYRKGQHISEITVTDRAGKRMVYGLPVYNISQSEYTFAIGVSGKDYTLLSGTNNQVAVPLNTPGVPSSGINYFKGIDNYYHRQTQPAYASGFLLTAILSPDYVDKTGNGITDDDLGTAIKFNYAKLTKPYKWRTPFKGATINKAQLADEDDDKATIVYGEKEIWYISSIESKTKVAYFITEPRRDAMGVTDYTGTYMDTTNAQRYLAEIRLYSKADMTRPIKVVKFQYDYELCRNLPNNADNYSGMNSDTTKGGKLTLKRVYFEYQNSTKGANFAYTFNYNKTVNGVAVNYGDMETDRWGVYKPISDSVNHLSNYQFPYTRQNQSATDTTGKSLADRRSALWQLSSIGLPTGGTINITYESKDYAYVQNQRAMYMSSIDSLIDGNGKGIDTTSSTLLKTTQGVRIKIPNTTVTGGDTTAWFRNTYLNSSDYLYTKFLVNVATPYYTNPYQQKYEFISCYSQIQYVSVSSSGGYANVFLQPRSEGGVVDNPIIFSAWQCMKNEYPRYAYPGFQSRTNDSETGSAVGTAVKAILTSISNLSELTENFYEKAFKKNFAAHVSVPRSFVRIVKQDGFKLGGGARVKKIQITDNWHTMAGNNDAGPASYGQAYTYTTIENGVTISSGVASYEPTVGCDENPLRQPVPYVEHIKGALDNFFDLEQPFGESFFPAPSVGYSKVTVTDLNKNGVPDPALRTGYSVDEFYTAKDFPVQVSYTQLSQNEDKPVNKLSFVGGTSIDELTMSQGYNVTVNDMHGKEKATRTFNQSGSEIASTVYYYKADSLGADSYKLNNSVSLVNADGTISNNKVIGRDIDFFTDFREYTTRNSGISDNLGFDMIGLVFVTFPFPHFPEPENDEYKQFRSACAIKVNTYYGIVDHIVKTENGSSITTTNLAFDGLTGDPVVTQTQNEFNAPLYSVNMPAYWAYAGMGGAYQNSGIELEDFETDSEGQFQSQYNNYLQAGDEIVNVTGGGRYWVVQNQALGGSSTTKKLVDRRGTIQVNFNVSGSDYVKLVRSGYRNMLSSTTESIVCLNNPIQGNQLSIRQNSDQTNLQVLNTSATTFNESWPIDQHGQPGDTTVIPHITYSIYGHVSDPPAPMAGAIWLKPITSQRRDSVFQLPTISLNLPAGTYRIDYSGVGDYIYNIDHSITLPNEGDDVLGTYNFTTTTGAYHDFYLTANNLTSTNPYVSMQIYNSSSALIYSTSIIADTNDTTYTYRVHINPYVRGFLGNWREYGSLVFQQSRHYNPGNSVRGVGVKQAGYVNNFSPYWYYSSSGWTTDTLGNRARWVTANTVTDYDDYGQQIENKDALGRFSAAKFDFNGELPAAVASNAMNREIYAASFEDGFFSPGTVPGYQPDVDFVKTGTDTVIKHYAIDTISHSGNYCVPLPSGGYTLQTLVHGNTLQTTNIISVDSLGEFDLKTDTGVYPVGFQPMPGKKYIFDVWVNDHIDTDTITRIHLTMNGTTVLLRCKALVENWKLIEGIVTIGSTNSLALVLTPTAPDIFLDDLRIHPFNSQMKSYAYDASTMRLMAEIDENGFATFYEYDDEGLLIRVKKETERGIMTIKESRSSYIKGL